MFRVADEAGEALFTGAARDRIRASIAGILVARMEALGSAHAAFATIKSELAQPWRTKQGGKRGAPTETSDLVSMGHLLHAEIKSAEDLVTRAVKLALDEEKSRGELAGTEGPLDAARFTGRHETLPVPEDMTAGEREAVRNLLTGFKSFIERRRAAGTPGTIDVTASAPGSAPVLKPPVSGPQDSATPSTAAAAPEHTTNGTPSDRGMASREGSNLPIHDGAATPQVDLHPSAPLAFASEPPKTRSRGAAGDDPV